MEIALLALQGNFARHAEKFRELGVPTRAARTADELADVSAIVLPGGESTAMLKLLDDKLKERLVTLIQKGTPVLATCAGVILLAKNVAGPHQESLGLLDIDITRNAYGRQKESFISSELTWTPSTNGSNGAVREMVEGVFIRAPRITRLGASVKSLLQHRGEAVFVQQDSIFGATFHPELSDSHVSPIYRLFLNHVERFNTAS